MSPILRICNQPDFETADLSPFAFAISIQGKGSRPAVLRPDFQGRRLNLYFDDVVEGPGVANRWQPLPISTHFLISLKLGYQWRALILLLHQSWCTAAPEFPGLPPQH